MSIELYSNLIHQEHNNLIPFSFIAENGMENVSEDSTLAFQIDTADTPYFDYKVVLGNVKSEITTHEPQAYVPKDDEIEHKNHFHVDIIAKDISGIKDYNVRMQEEIYGYETPEYTFNTPKFSWSNEFFGETYNTDEEPVYGKIWVGSENNLIGIKYDFDHAEKTDEYDIGSESHTIVFQNGTNKTYITTYDNIDNYSIDGYWSPEGIITTVYQNNSISNSDNGVIALTEKNKVWSLYAYSGKVISRDVDTLEIINEYNGFDAPRKMVWSIFHNCYFIAGTNILWQLKDGIKKAVYQVKGYDFADISISPYGCICMILDGANDDIIRVLKPDLYGILINETITDGIAKSCVYCDQGIFYILVELGGGRASYSLVSYIYDSVKKVLTTNEEVAEISTTTTTTTPTAPANKVEIDYPSEGDQFIVGEEMEITWRSTGSATDNVKIELYKGDTLIKVLSAKTPNTGIYKWALIPSAIQSGVDYNIKITWIGATELPENIDFSDYFIITTGAETTTTTTTQSIRSSVGIAFNSKLRHVVNVLGNGLVGFFDLNDMQFYGLFESEVSGISCLAIQDNAIHTYSNVSLVRLFVGSDPYLSDMWDSGVVETDKTAMYYGGGNNLVPGETYFVNIQVYDSNYGWSKVQTKEWVMPQ